MAAYKNILLAVDLRVTHDSYTLSRAVDMAKYWHAKLHIIHVMEPIYGYGESQGQHFVEIERQLQENARTAFKDLVSSFDIAADQLIIQIGSPKQVIVDQAEKLGIDLVIVGAHSKTGLHKLIGSTASGIINNAHCDVLTVRTVE
jgi:universal stress protein A